MLYRVVWGGKVDRSLGGDVFCPVVPPALSGFVAYRVAKGQPKKNRGARGGGNPFWCFLPTLIIFLEIQERETVGGFEVGIKRGFGVGNCFEPPLPPGGPHGDNWEKGLAGERD